MYVKRKQVRKLVRKKVALHVVKERKLMHAVQHNINSNMDSTVWTKYIQSRYTSLHGDIHPKKLFDGVCSEQNFTTFKIPGFLESPPPRPPISN